MNKTLKLQMRNVWKDENGNDEISPDFVAGFESAVDVLLPLLEEAAPHVYSYANAVHMMDGFKKKKHQIDDLVVHIRLITCEA